LNPSAENIATQANEENPVTGGRFSNMTAGLRQSLDVNQLLTQDEEEEKTNNNNAATRNLIIEEEDEMQAENNEI